MISVSFEKYAGCLLGGAIGDALGAPIEFLSLPAIRSKYGNQGVRNYVEFPDGCGEFTDDTQMTLFTAEALLRAYHRATLKGIGGALPSIMHQSYLRWLQTQDKFVDWGKMGGDEQGANSGWLVKEKGLYKRRAPGLTCLDALSSGKAGTMESPINNSKGCGTIMRVAPIGLFYNENGSLAFDIACEASAITHGHPTGYLSAGVLASIIADISQGVPLQTAIDNSVAILKTKSNHEETLAALNKCLELFNKTKTQKQHVYEEVETLGAAWVAEEALSISLYCSLLFENDYRNGVLFSVNHSGDSDSTGAITGNILGTINGHKAIPHDWKEKLRYHDIVLKTSQDLHTKIKGNMYDKDESWWEEYPGY